MNFYQKYDLERLIADGETKTFRAVENSTGRAVFLHFFNPEGLSILAALKAKLEKTRGKPVLPLIELGEFAGSPYAVTEQIQQFTTLRQWVDSLPSVAAEAPVAQGPRPGNGAPATVEIPKPQLAPEPRPVPETKAGEFTRMFEAPAKPAPVPDTRAGEFTRMFESPPASPQPAPMAETHSGEFTRFFGAAAEPPKSSNSSSTPAPSNPPDTGEFTRMFHAPRVASEAAPQPRQYNEYQDLFGDTQVPSASKPAPENAQPSWPASAPSDLETGQFTKLFGSGPSGEAINIEEEQARAARAKQPESRPFQAPTEFTRVFGPEEGASAPPRPSMRMDGASGIFGSIDELKTVVPTTTKSGVPGEYTRMTTRAELEAEQAAAEQTMQPGAATQPAPAPAAKRTGLIIGLAIGTVVLIVGMIVLIVIARRH